MTGYPWSAGDQLLANDLNAAIANAGGHIVTPPLNYIGPHSATVGIASGVLIAAGTYTTALTIQTLPGSTGNIFLRADGSASVANTGMLIQAGGGARSFGAPGFPIPIGDITAITDAATPQTVLISGG
jgi:hypothetical protein